MLESSDRLADAATTEPSAPHRPTRRRAISRQPLFLGGLLAGLLVIGGGLWCWHLYQQRNAPPRNPFTASVMASVQFQLYYPTWLPDGYHIDTKSVTEPNPGVVVFIAIGPKKADKLYFSEEARPSTYDIGGFFAKFSDLQEIGFGEGSIAVGKVGNTRTEIASRITNKIWIIANTNDALPYGQLVNLMKNMTFSY
jgi:hypothetical protein